MNKNIYLTMILISLPFLSGLSFAQDLPNGNLIVNTRCKISHGHTIEDVIYCGARNT